MYELASTFLANKISTGLGIFTFTLLFHAAIISTVTPPTIDITGGTPTIFCMSGYPFTNHWTYTHCVSKASIFLWLFLLRRSLRICKASVKFTVNG